MVKKVKLKCSKQQPNHKQVNEDPNPERENRENR